MKCWSALLVAAAAGGLVGLGCGGSGGGGSGSGVVAITPGASARDFVDDAVYTSLVVEVDHVQGQTPSSTALALLEQRLEERCAKPGGVTIIVDDAIPSAGTTYSVAQNRALERQHRDLTSSGTTAAFYVLYLDGRSDQDGAGGDVLGWAHGPSSVGLFRETIQSTANLLVTAPEIEGAVLVHEAGHLLGLVNTGTPMVASHEDAAHRGHDVDDGCIMHWQIDTSNIITLIQSRGSLPTQFDARCIEDLRAIGGR